MHEGEGSFEGYSSSDKSSDDSLPELTSPSFPALDRMIISPAKTHVTPRFNTAPHGFFAEPLGIGNAVEEENVFAELAVFAESKLYVLGNVCPVSSPQKSKTPEMVKKQSGEVLESALYTMSMSGDKVEFERENQDLFHLNVHHGRNYEKMMRAAKALLDQFKKLTPDKLKKCLLGSADELTDVLHEDLRTKLTGMQLIVWLCLSDRYPLVPMRDIFESIASSEWDVYRCFKEFDKFLYQSTLTKEACELYFFEMDFPASERLKLKK